MINLKSAWTRLPLILSAVWLVAGGYWSFMRHSYEWRWARQTTHDMCVDQTDYSACVADKQALYSPSPHWLPIAAEVVVGLLLIWLAIAAARWIIGKGR